MGAVHSVDSCSAGNEQKKDDIFRIPSAQELAEYNRLEKAEERAVARHQKTLPRSIPDANLSVQRKLGVDMTEKDNLETSSKFASSPPRHGNQHQHHHGRLSSSFSKIRHKSMRRVRQAGSSVFGKVSHAAGAVGQSSRRLFHPHGHHHHHNTNTSNGPGKKTVSVVSSKVRGGVLLRGCYTDEEHRQKARAVVEMLRPLKGQEALVACEFEYRKVPLDESGRVILPIETKVRTSDESMSASRTELPLPNMTEQRPPETETEEGLQYHQESPRYCTTKDDDSERESASQGGRQTLTGTAQSTYMTRLFHIESNTMITMKNRKEFIADGDMYDTIARITQEYAQEVMARDGDLEWITICEAGNNPEPIRALVSRRLVEDESKLDREPTLLIATGKGKVRAGVFSRQHLLTSGLECSTAVPIVQEAAKRGMIMVVVDPNVHGDRLGMSTFEKSMARLFRRWEHASEEKTPPLSQRDLYVLSHSQSGAQLARYLLEKSEKYIPHLRAVAFTDSTHNIQWAKSKEIKQLKDFLESDDCIYFRCSKDENNDPLLNPLSSLGEEVETDEFWKHRFGNIKTLCAGTSEHSLTNWFAKDLIWRHFDSVMPKDF